MAGLTSKVKRVGSIKRPGADRSIWTLVFEQNRRADAEERTQAHLASRTVPS